MKQLISATLSLEAAEIYNSWPKQKKSEKIGYFELSIQRLMSVKVFLIMDSDCNAESMESQEDRVVVLLVAME